MSDVDFQVISNSKADEIKAIADSIKSAQISTSSQTSKSAAGMASTVPDDNIEVENSIKDAIAEEERDFLNKINGLPQFSGTLDKNNMQIGTTILDVPPSNINVLEMRNNIQFPSLRSELTALIKSGHGNLSITISITFPDTNSVNNKLRPIIAQLRSFPFIPIYSDYLTSIIQVKLPSGNKKIEDLKSRQRAASVKIDNLKNEIIDKIDTALKNRSIISFASDIVRDIADARDLLKELRRERNVERFRTRIKEFQASNASLYRRLFIGQDGGFIEIQELIEKNISEMVPLQSEFLDIQKAIFRNSNDEIRIFDFVPVVLSDLTASTNPDSPKSIDVVFNFIYFNSMPFAGYFLFLDASLEPTPEIRNCYPYIKHYQSRWLTQEDGGYSEGTFEHMDEGVLFKIRQLMKRFPEEPENRNELSRLMQRKLMRQTDEGLVQGYSVREDKSDSRPVSLSLRYPYVYDSLVEIEANDLLNAYRVLDIDSSDGSTVINSISVSLRNRIATFSTLESYYPSSQYMGSENAMISIEVLTKDERMIQAIHQMKTDLEAVSLYMGRKIRRNNQVFVKNQRINMFGIRSMQLDRIMTTPVDTGLTRIEMRFTEFTASIDWVESLDLKTPASRQMLEKTLEIALDKASNYITRLIKSMRNTQYKSDVEFSNESDFFNAHKDLAFDRMCYFELFGGSFPFERVFTTGIKIEERDVKGFSQHGIITEDIIIDAFGNKGLGTDFSNTFNEEERERLKDLAIFLPPEKSLMSQLTSTMDREELEASLKKIRDLSFEQAVKELARNTTIRKITNFMVLPDDHKKALALSIMEKRKSFDPRAISKIVGENLVNSFFKNYSEALDLLGSEDSYLILLALRLGLQKGSAEDLGPKSRAMLFNNKFVDESVPLSKKHISAIVDVIISNPGIYLHKLFKLNQLATKMYTDDLISHIQIKQYFQDRDDTGRRSMYPDLGLMTFSQMYPRLSRTLESRSSDILPFSSNTPNRSDISIGRASKGFLRNLVTKLSDWGILHDPDEDEDTVRLNFSSELNPDFFVFTQNISAAIGENGAAEAIRDTYSKVNQRSAMSPLIRKDDASTSALITENSRLQEEMEMKGTMQADDITSSKNMDIVGPNVIDSQTDYDSDEPATTHSRTLTRIARSEISNRWRETSNNVKYVHHSFELESDLGKIDPDAPNHHLSLLREAIKATPVITSSMIHAYPSFRIYFIEEDAEHWRLLDDFYSYSAISELHIRRTKWSTDIAEITLLNFTGALDRNKSVDDFQEGTDSVDTKNRESDNGLVISKDTRELVTREKFLQSFMLDVGTRIMIKLGYGSDEARFETVFTGQIAEVSKGDIVNIVAQSYASELTQPISSHEHGHESDAADVVKTIMNKSPAGHFGKWTPLKNPFIATKMSRLTELRSLKPDNFISLKTWIFNNLDPRFENIFLPRKNGLKEFFSWTREWIIPQITGLESLHELVRHHPGYCCSVQPYGGRATLFFGRPEQRYFFTNRKRAQEYWWFKHSVKKSSEIKRSIIQLVMSFTRSRLGRDFEAAFSEYGSVYSAILAPLPSKKHRLTGKKLDASIASASDPNPIIYFREKYLGQDSVLNAQAAIQKIYDRLGKDFADQLFEVFFNVTNNEQQFFPMESLSRGFDHVVKAISDANQNIKAQSDFLSLEHFPDTIKRRERAIRNVFRTGFAFSRGGFSRVIENIAAFSRISEINGGDPILFMNGITYGHDRYLSGTIARSMFIYDSILREITSSPDVDAFGDPREITRRINMLTINPNEFYRKIFVGLFSTIRGSISDMVISGKDGISISRKDYNYTIRSVYANSLLWKVFLIDFVKFLESEIDDVDDNGLIRSMFDASPKKIYDEMRTSRAEDDEIKPNPRTKIFRGYHYVDSKSHIIQNNILATRAEMANHIRVMYPDQVKSSGSGNGISVSKGTDWNAHDIYISDPEDLDSADILTKIMVEPNAENLWQADLCGFSHMAEQVGKMYRGNLLIRGNERIKPYDIVYMYDMYNRMWGPIEVDEVIHHFSFKSGFVTDIRPCALVIPNSHSAAYQAKAMAWRMHGAAAGVLMAGTGLMIAAGITIPITLAAVGMSFGAWSIYTKIKYGMSAFSMIAGKARVGERLHPVDVIPLTYHGHAFTSGLKGDRGLTWAQRLAEKWATLKEGYEISMQVFNGVRDPSVDWRIL